jgi:hypothetical protein
MVRYMVARMELVLIPAPGAGGALTYAFRADD